MEGIKDISDVKVYTEKDECPIAGTEGIKASAVPGKPVAYFH